MTTGAPSLGDLAAAVAAVTGGGAADEEGVWRATGARVARLALALDERDATAEWVASTNADALFVHRPWRLELAAIGDAIGILFSHRPFDERLTTGVNPTLASALAMRGVTPFGERDGRALAMTGDVDDADAATWIERVAAEFGGIEARLPGDGRRVRRVAVASAMTDALLREAHALRVDLYVTGALRQPGVAAATDAGIAVVAVGHRRSEWWGLGALARALEQRFVALACVVAPGVPDEGAAER